MKQFKTNSVFFIKQAALTRIITRPEAERVRANVGHRMLSGFFYGGLYGSFRDGTWLVSKSKKDNTSEIDGDLLIYAGFLSEEEQSKCIHYIEGDPGYVYIDVTEISHSKFELMFPDGNDALLEREGKKYMSAKQLKGVLSDVTDAFKSLNDEFMDSFTLFMQPGEAKPLGASAPVLLRGGHGINVHADLVICVGCCGWPRAADSWANRKRKTWPNKALVQEITNSVFHLVNKPSTSGDADIDFRLSFSSAESKLMDTFTGPKLATYMILKNIFNENCKLKYLDILKTYHLKTVFFWSCEEQSEDFWIMEEIEKCVSSVLNLLVDSFTKGIIRHYFIPEINLLKNISSGLTETTEELKLIKQGLVINIFSPDPETEAVAMMDLASVKEQYNLGVLQLAQREENILSDMRYMGKSWMRQCSRFISDCASMACQSAVKGFLDKTQLWFIEETLSCCYAILSAFVDKLDSLETDSHNKQMVLLFVKFLTKRFMKNNAPDQNVHKPDMNIEKRIKNEEYPHGYHEIPDNLIYLPYAELLLKVIFIVAKMTISKDIETLLSKIVNPVWSEQKWDLDILIEAVKPVLPEFKWSDEGHLSVHQLAQDDVWKLEIPFENLVKQKSNASQSLDLCERNCFEKRLNSAKNLVFDSNTFSVISMFHVICQGKEFFYAEGNRLDNMKSINLLTGNKAQL